MDETPIDRTLRLVLEDADQANPDLSTETWEALSDVDAFGERYLRDVADLLDELVGPAGRGSDSSTRINPTSILSDEEDSVDVVDRLPAGPTEWPGALKAVGGLLEAMVAYRFPDVSHPAQKWCLLEARSQAAELLQDALNTFNMLTDEVVRQLGPGRYPDPDRGMIMEVTPAGTVRELAAVQ